MTFIGYVLLRLGVFAIFLVLSAPLLFGLGFLIEFSKAHESLGPLGFIAAVLIFVWFLGNGWMVQQTANHMTFENKKLGPAIRMSFLDARLRLCFLPVIGRWFTPGGDENHEDKK